MFAWGATSGDTQAHGGRFYERRAIEVSNDESRSPMSPHADGAIKVRCGSCVWRGDRIVREDRPKWGNCPTCGSVLWLAATLAERRAAPAKAGELYT